MVADAPRERARMANPISPDAPCFTVLPSGGLCGHPFRRHFGVGGTCIAGHHGKDDASVCACLAFDPGDGDGDRP